jgi:serine/threonine protein kinase
LNLEPGQIFETRFKIIQALGAGGLGTVYKAIQIDCDRVVALKILHAEISTNEENCERFLREAKALNELEHEGIVSIYHVGLSEANLPYLVMEFIEGDNLRQLMNQSSPLPVLQAVSICKQAAEALDYVHSKNIVHRDLKPENLVMIKNTEQVKVVDFGLARLLNEQRSTTTGVLIGSPNYMSPEQCMGKPVDRRSDIYSLAVCFYEMLAGERPFDADSAVGIIYKHMHEPVPKISTNQSRTFNKQLNEFFAKGMAKEPAARYQSMAELLDDLSKLESQLDLTYAKSKLSVSNTSQSKKKSATIMIGLLILLLGGIAAVQLNRISKMPQRDAPSTKSAHAAPIERMLKSNGEYDEELISKFEQEYGAPRLIEALKAWREKKQILSAKDEATYDLLLVRCYMKCKNAKLAEQYADKIPKQERFLKHRLTATKLVASIYRDLRQPGNSLAFINKLKHDVDHNSSDYADLLDVEAQSLIAVERNSEAIPILNESLAIQRNIRGIKGSNDIRYELIGLLAKAGRLREAEQVIRDTEECSLYESSHESVVSSNRSLQFDTIAKEEDRKQNLELSLQALRTHSDYSGLSTKQTKAIAENYKEISYIFASLGPKSSKDCVYYMSKALIGFKVIDEWDSTFWPVAYLLEKFDQSGVNNSEYQQFLDLLTPVCIQPGARARVLTATAKVVLRTGRAKEVEQYLQEAFSLAKRFPDKQSLASIAVFEDIASIYRDARMYSQTRKVLEFELGSGLPAIPRVSVFKLLAVNSFDAGRDSQGFDYSKQAVDCLKPALEENLNLPYSKYCNTFEAALQQYADALIARHKKDEAKKLLQDQIDFVNSRAPKSFLASKFYHVQARSFLCDLSSTIAAAAVQEEIAILDNSQLKQRVKDKSLIDEAYMKALFTEAQILTLRNHPQEALLTLNKAMTTADQIPDGEPKFMMVRYILVLQGENYEQSKQPEKARQAFARVEREWFKFDNARDNLERIKLLLDAQRVKMRSGDFESASSNLERYIKTQREYHHGNDFPQAKESHELLQKALRHESDV